VHYADSSFIPLNAVIVEWAKASNEPKAATLQRICHFGRCGLVFGFRAFKRSDGVFLGVQPISEIANALFSVHALVRTDAQAALDDIKVATDAVQDFCRLTRTRLPDVALGRERRGDWLQAVQFAPPSRDPTDEELSAAAALQKERKRKAEQRAEARKPGAIRVLSARGARPGRRWNIGSAGRSPREQIGTRSQSVQFPGALQETQESEQAAADPSSQKTKIHDDHTEEKRSNVARRPVPQADFDAWYKDRCTTLVAESRHSSETQDKEDAEARFPDRLINRNQLRLLRRKYAPDAWRNPGPRKSRNLDLAT
jgi:hypothetical protein